MKRIVFIVLAGMIAGVLLYAVTPSYGHEDHKDGDSLKFTKHFNGSLFRIGEKGLYSIEILPDESEYKIGKDVIGIVVHNAKDGDVKGAELTLTYSNRKTDEVSSGTFGIVDKGNGLYIISNLDLKRDRQLKLKVHVRKDSSEDVALFLFPDIWEQKISKGSYSLEEINK